MDSILKEFNNRELAIITWIFIAIIAFLFLRTFREFITNISKIIFSKTFIILYLLLFGYLSLIILGLYAVRFWDFSLIKDSLLWLVCVGIILVMNSINQDSNYFKKIAIDSFKITIIIEFVINLHVFSYITELIVFPILFLLIITKVIADSEKKLKSISNIFEYFIIIIGLIVLFIAIYKTIQNFHQDFTFSNFQKLLLPSILTILFIPFSYLFAIYCSYETLFVLLKNIKNEKWTKNKIKFMIIKSGKLSLSRIRVITTRLNLYELCETENLNQYIESLSKPITFNKPKI